MAVALDILTRVIDVRSAPDVIVVFTDSSYVEPQVFPEYSPIGNKAQFLDTWTTLTYSGDQYPLKNTAYRISSGAGEFMETTAVQLPVDKFGREYGGSFIHVSAYAMQGAVTESLERARKGSELMAPALFLTFVPNADLPYDVAPPGLLWSARTGTMASNVIRKWKIRYGSHREKGDPGSPPSTLPNSMVQCYPLGPPHDGFNGLEKTTFTGYWMSAYRLDTKGTGTVYSEVAAYYFDPDGKIQNLPPEWSKEIGGIGDPYIFGIPFDDPPPLITTDLV